VIVVCGRVGHVAAEVGDSAQKIGAGDDADDAIAVDDGQALDVALLHQPDDLVQRRVFARRIRIGGHDLADLTALFMDEFAGGLAGSEQNLEPARAPSLGADFGAPQEIAFGHDADQLAGRIHHRQPADVIAKHGGGSLGDRGFGPDRDDLAGHDLMGTHGGPSCSSGKLVLGNSACWNR
jgi:hypothetical protein